MYKSCTKRESSQYVCHDIIYLLSVENTLYEYKKNLFKGL